MASFSCTTANALREVWSGAGQERLYVGTVDPGHVDVALLAGRQAAVGTVDLTALVDYEPAGRVKLDGEEWTVPNLQERRAIIHAAQTEIEWLQDLVLALEKSSG